MKPDTDGILIMPWAAWEFHPTWLTEKQHKERGLIPCGEPVAKVYYINKYIEGHYILLFDVEKGQPRPISEKKRAAMEKAKATAERNRTCVACGQLNATKIIRTPKLCDTCYALQSEVEQARAWLADPDAVILDTETNELFGEILSIGCLEVVTGKTLLDMLIKPQAEIDETLYRVEETDWGEVRERSTAYGIHGISNEMVKDAPSFPEVWPSIQYAIEGKRLLIFNSSYDMECLRGDLSRHFIDYSRMEGSAECVMRWYAGYHGEWSRKYRDYKFIGLTQALSEQDVAVDAEAHNALGDCQRTLALIKAIAAKKAPLDKE
jgi:DNA polymerase-3 subunit epsilon